MLDVPCLSAMFSLSFYIFVILKEGGKYGGPHALEGFPEGLIEIEGEPDQDLPQQVPMISWLVD